MTGLPSDHIRKIEEEEYPALHSDLARIEKALLAVKDGRAVKQENENEESNEEGIGNRDVL